MESDSTKSPGYTKSVLTIQSHVVHGYVGNRTSTFPLQVSGWDADVLNTVQLSNHTGYGKIYGQKLSGAEIWDQYEGLVNIGMDEEYDAVLTGYVPTAEGTQIVGNIAKDLVEKRRKLKEEYHLKKQKGELKEVDEYGLKVTEPVDVLWVLDPVLGDHGRFYVSQDVIPVYIDLLASGCISAVTPNQFEAEILSGIKIQTKGDVVKVLEKLHREFKIKHVVITSLKLKEEYGDNIVTVGSTASFGQEPAEFQPFYFEYPSVDAYITGTGDLFTSIFVDRLHKYLSYEREGKLSKYREEARFEASQEKDLVLASTIGEVLGVVQAVIKRTAETPRLKQGPAGVYGNIRSMKNAELRLVQSIDLINGTTFPYQPRKF